MLATIQKIQDGCFWVRVRRACGDEQIETRSLTRALNQSTLAQFQVGDRIGVHRQDNNPYLLYGEVSKPKRIPHFECMECRRKFYTVSAAERAARNGCTSCGGVDIDVA